MPTVFYGAGNFVLQSKVENEVRFAEEILKRTDNFNRLISFYFKKELQNTLEVHNLHNLKHMKHIKHNKNLKRSTHEY